MRIRNVRGIVSKISYVVMFRPRWIGVWYIYINKRTLCAQRLQSTPWHNDTVLVLVNTDNRSDIIPNWPVLSGSVDLLPTPSFCMLSMSLSVNTLLLWIQRAGPCMRFHSSHTLCVGKYRLSSIKCICKEQSAFSIQYMRIKILGRMTRRWPRYFTEKNHFA